MIDHISPGTNSLPAGSEIPPRSSFTLVIFSQFSPRIVGLNLQQTLIKNLDICVPQATHILYFIYKHDETNLM